MENFKDFKAKVKKEGYGSTQFSYLKGEEIYLYRGVRDVFCGDDAESQKIMDIVARFQKGDFGDAESHGKDERQGHEYGRYEIAPFEDDEEDTAVWVHRASNVILVYFQFER